MAAVEATHDLSTLAGIASVSEGRAADAVDGVVPGRVVEPATAEGLAAALAWCSANRKSVVVRGGGTKLDWGRPVTAIDVVVSSRRLTGVLRYEPGDLTVTVGAGMAIDDLNRELAVRGQWLPIDVRGQAATIGGVIASNESGPLRQLYGTPRDQLIGIRLATADGRLASAGGHVVKNVAGYDLGKLMTGSFGSLAGIVSATFRLAPIPASTVTVVSSFRDRADLAGAVAEVAGSQLDPLSVDVDAAGPNAGGEHRGFLHLIVRFGGVASVTEDQAAAATRLIAGFSPLEQELMSGDADQALWNHRAMRTWHLPGAVIKLSWLPAAIADVVGALDDIRTKSGAAIELSGRAALGTGLVRVAGDLNVQLAVVNELRARPVVGNVGIVRADAALRRQVEVWGVAPGTLAVSRLIKQRLDPAGVLNAGRGPI